MKEIDDTETPENESPAVDLLVLETWHALWLEETRLLARLTSLEKEVTLLLEQRETARAPEGGEVDPEWYGGD